MSHRNENLSALRRHKRLRMQAHNSRNRKIDSIEVSDYIQIRNTEIGAFWQRTIFFWGLFIAAFSLYFQSGIDAIKTLSLGFAIVTSFILFSISQSSAWWQRYWESKIEENYAKRIAPSNQGTRNCQRLGSFRLTKA